MSYRSSYNDPIRETYQQIEELHRKFNIIFLVLGSSKPKIAQKLKEGVARKEFALSYTYHLEDFAEEIGRSIKRGRKASIIPSDTSVLQVVKKLKRVEGGFKNEC